MTSQVAASKPDKPVTREGSARRPSGLLNLESVTSVIVFISYGGLISIAIAIMTW